ncbi:hypothetical protein F5X68DRAFT_146027 [Plectosphaerella plurivora]|uniref:Uncharacterized protein n=1 Tax=Plectosphaerella plurivora TaxID=936078 RepID=A0A9P9AHX0_9PEZI|nr:hypothetical protein F5X68DRAFT_146027 [Plectosphaerella plurivora]
MRSPKTRSLSDSGGTPSKLSPSPLIVEASRRTSKDDNHIPDYPPAPSTPNRTGFAPRGLSIHMIPRREGGTSPVPNAAAVFTKPAPLSPKLEQIYASPTNILPRRSRGLDFSRAATSLHHSTLAESSPDSSPTIGGRAVNIPARRSNDYGATEQSSTSLWSVMGNQERAHISSSLGSAHPAVSDSSSSEDDDLMDEDTEDVYLSTPQASRTGLPSGISGGLGSPAMNSLISFQQRQRPRKQPKKKIRAPLGLGFSTSTISALSKSPPNKEMPMSHSRRESISWQANQLHISSTEEERMGSDSINSVMGTPTSKRQTIMRQPKTKNFARIKHALLEEGAPVETEVRREAEVIRQVRESDMDLEPRVPTAQSSPNLANQDVIEDVAGEEMMGEGALSESFKHQAIKHSKGPKFWDTFSESSSIGARTTPPPASFMPRDSSSGMSEDINMDSPSLGATAGPSAAEITRRINNKRRREDDFDPIGFKRRAVSPGMSVHNSPVMQSPMQRDVSSWGSRPGSNAGEKNGSSAPSENGSGSMGGTPGNAAAGGGASSRANNGTKGRVGYLGMHDTHDGLMRMSIE